MEHETIGGKLLKMRESYCWRCVEKRRLVLLFSAHGLMVIGGVGGGVEPVPVTVGELVVDGGVVLGVPNVGVVGLAGSTPVAG